MAAATAHAVTLVENGQPRAVIILPDAPSPAAKLGAQILRDHLKQISGATLLIKKESSISGNATPEQPWVLVGEGKLAGQLGLSTASLGPGGMVLCAKANVLALFGTDDHTATDPDGTRYAVVTFLEDKLGVRWLWPGELGKVLPRRATITVGDFDQKFTPRLVQRRIRDSHYNDRLETGLKNLGFTAADYRRQRADAEKTTSESGGWFDWQKLGGSFNVSGGHAFGHLWEKYGKEHPDWFAMQPNGSRDQSRNGARSRLCKSNPELIAAIAREKIEELNKNPKLAGVSLSPNDGGANTFCTCPKCEALDAPSGRKVKLWDNTSSARREFEHVSLTDRMISFWNAVAEQVARVHPNALFTVDAYSAYRSPPLLRTLHPNLVVRFVNISYTDETLRQQGLADWNEWAKAAKKIYFRPNLMLAGRRSGAPMIYAHKFAQDFRHLASHGMWGTDFDSCMHNWSTQGLNYYVVARLHWNPDQDVDDLITDYCRAGFGPAAQSVRRYFDELEAITNQIAASRQALNEDIDTAKIEPLNVFTPEVIAKLRNRLHEARRQATGDETVLKRLVFLETGLRWTEMEGRVHAFFRKDGKVDKVGARKACDERYEMMQAIFQNSFLAVNVAAVSWGEDGYLRRLHWKHPTAETRNAR
ncbi:MAG: DUF4838 domain-containing protein [Verrucomicrobia bacterium]|nr:DUF4838 domain-containing protein [Verrucomicrobiota bacterium]